MRKPAKLEAEIAALAAEVEEVARKRGRALPTTQDWVDLFMALGVTYEEIADAPQDGEGDVAVFARLTRREITPAAEPLLESLLAAEAAALARDRPACYQTLRELRAPLTDLLARRAQTWCQRWLRAPEFEELYYGPRQSLRGASPDASLAELDPDFAEQIETKLARMKGWPLALLAGKALGCAATELSEWREWVTGEVVPAPARQHHTGGYPLGDRPLTVLPEEEEEELVRRGVVSAEDTGRGQGPPTGARRFNAGPRVSWVGHRDHRGRAQRPAVLWLRSRRALL